MLIQMETGIFESHGIIIKVLCIRKKKETEELEVQQCVVSFFFFYLFTHTHPC